MMKFILLLFASVLAAQPPRLEASRVGIEFEETVDNNKYGKGKLTLLTSSPVLGTEGTLYAVDALP